MVLVELCKAWYPYVSAFMDWSIKYVKTALVTSVYTRYGEIYSDVIREMEQSAWDNEDLGSL